MKRFVCFAFASKPAVCCFHEDGPQIYYRKKRNQLLTTKPGYSPKETRLQGAKTFKRMTGQATYSREMWRVDPPVQIPSSLGSGSKLFDSGSRCLVTFKVRSTKFESLASAQGSDRNDPKSATFSKNIDVNH